MSSTLLAAAIGLVCGLAGGAAGALLVRGEPARIPAASEPDPSLRNAIDALAREVRALRESQPSPLTEPTRQPAPAAGSAPIDVDRLVAAIDRLTNVATPSATRPGVPPQLVQSRAKNEALLREVAQMDYDVRGRKYRFLTYQQVLDQFGPPDEVNSDFNWIYESAENGAVVFRFADGMLVNIN